MDIKDKVEMDITDKVEDKVEMDITDKVEVDIKDKVEMDITDKVEVDIKDKAEAAETFTLCDLTFSYLASESCLTEWNSTRVGRRVGSEGNGDVAVPIDIGLGPCEESDQFLKSFSHQTYLPTWFIIDDPSTFTVLHQSFSSTLADYISYLKSQNISPVLTYQFPNNTQYKYVSEEYRMLVRKLVCFVLHLHSLGKSLVKLSVDNLCILNGELKVWGLRLKRKDDISVQRDFKFVYKVTKKIFCLGGFVIGKKATEDLPKDFADVITMMRLIDSSDGPIENHLGLLSAKEKISFFRNSGDFYHGLSGVDIHWYSEALRKMGNHKGWKKSVVGGPMLKCLNYRGYGDEGSKYDVNLNLITLCRNAATHLHRDIVAENKAVDANYSSPVQNIDLECYIMQCFGLELTKFKKWLASYGIVHIFE